MCGYLEQIRERRDRAGGDHVEASSDALRLRELNRRAQIQGLGELVEKFRPQTPWFDQCNRPFDEAGDDDSGQPCARSDIDPRRRWMRFVTHELGRIENVPVPDLVESRRRNEVLPVIFLA
jgi:hypothetical protein